MTDKIREAFEKSKYEWEAHDDWRYADREACWKFFFEAGRQSMLEELEQVGWEYQSEDPFDSGQMMLCESEPNRKVKWPLYRLPEGVTK